jgi:uncharacterized protein YggU (UPF0235/DUF167 family)
MLDVWVTAPPVEGAANAAVLRAVARELGVPPSAVSLRSGARSSVKVVEVNDAAGVRLARKPSERRRRGDG